jgi:hypothetical protein
MLHGEDLVWECFDSLYWRRKFKCNMSRSIRGIPLISLPCDLTPPVGHVAALENSPCCDPIWSSSMYIHFTLGWVKNQGMNMCFLLIKKTE